MTGPDEGLASLRAIISSFQAFCEKKGSVTEADTRAQVIDRVLQDVCGWPRSEISREEHVDRGFIDYSLTVRSKRYVAVEAKREGLPFVLPRPFGHRTLKINGTLTTDREIKSAIDQVRGYCDDGVIRYAIATNGYTWIVFRALREDIPWREGMARIFPSLEYITENFTEFWNLLSYDAIANGSLDEEFGSSLRVSRELHRVTERLFNADLPLQRNRLHAQLGPVIRGVFEDIGDQRDIEILEKCYVHALSLKVVASDLDVVIEDDIPKFLDDEGTGDSGQFRMALPWAMQQDGGQLLLLLGGIGSGKTTFLRSYQRVTGLKTLGGHTVWFHLDFLKAPISIEELESFIWSTILDDLRGQYLAEDLESRDKLKRIFADKTIALEQTILSHSRRGSTEYEQTLSPYLERWRASTSDYVPRLLRFCRRELRRSVVLFLDNVDQLTPAYQAQIFLLAQRVSRVADTVTVIALREESYYAASIQRIFTAYTNHKFHIASPRFRKMLEIRLNYATDVLRKDTSPFQLQLPGGLAFDQTDVSDFLGIVGRSVLYENKNIARFIESICFGNMRMALQMFTTFLVSGATDVDKMLRIHRRDGGYDVPFHEFVKSVMLGDRRYYKESQSPIMNLWDCGSEKNSSHFTGVRILKHLLAHRAEASSEGQGYVDIARISGLFEEVFDAREDFVRTLDRLVARQLVETNTRSTESILGASHVRATSAGWYFSRHLLKKFAYLDLVLQDTPISSAAVERNLRGLVEQVDNLGDREELKIERLGVRFQRVRKFLEYLESEERGEVERYPLRGRQDVLSERIVKPMSDAFEDEHAWILHRVRENRERYTDEPQIEDVEDEQFLGDRLEEDTASK